MCNLKSVPCSYIYKDSLIRDTVETRSLRLRHGRHASNSGGPCLQLGFCHSDSAHTGRNTVKTSSLGLRHAQWAYMEQTHMEQAHMEQVHMRDHILNQDKLVWVGTCLLSCICSSSDVLPFTLALVITMHHLEEKHTQEMHLHQMNKPSYQSMCTFHCIALHWAEAEGVSAN